MPKAESIRDYKTPKPTTDVIIEYSDGKKEGIVLIERKNPPYGLALPGGIAEIAISFEENAIKEAKEETNLEVVLLNPKRPWAYSDPKRDPRYHMATCVYIGRGSGELKAQSDAKEAGLYTIDEVKGLLGKGKFAFDHEKIITDYLEYKGHFIDDIVKSIEAGYRVRK